MAAIVYLKRSGFDFYSSSLAGTLSFDFPATMVQDLEILNGDEFHAAIHTFVETNKISPETQGVIVLSSPVYFEKELPADLTTEKQSTTIEEFVNNAPFNDPKWKLFSADKAQKIIVANGDMLDAIRIAFAKESIKMLFAVPAFTISPDLESMGGLTVDTGKTIGKKIDSLKSQSIDIAEDVIIFHSSSDNVTTPKESNKLLLIGGIVFIIIGLAAAIFMFIKQQEENAKLSQIRPTPLPATQIPVSTPTVAGSSTTNPTESPEIASSAAIIDEADVEDLTVQILNGSGVSGQADIIRRELQTIGFQTIRTGNANGINLPRTLIVFSENVPQEVKNRVMDEVKTITNSTISTQQSSESAFDIVITTSRPTITPTETE